MATMRLIASKIGFILSLLVLTSCGRVVTECGGMALNVNRLTQIQNAAFSSNSKAYLITPNPLDATGNVGLQSLDSALGSLLDSYFLPGLILPSRLENSFLKVRINKITDSAGLLASPNSNGEFLFPISDIHYGETMAYHSLTAIQSYVEALGFQTDKSRPFYVMVKAEGSTHNPADVNAYYNHNPFSSSAPRELKIFGETAHSAWQDRDIFWHEFGHYFLESLTGSRGVDQAGDAGAVFSEGGAIHECFADYGAESLSGRGYLGRWIARNFPEYAVGQPLRTAHYKNDEFENFREVIDFDSSGKNLDRYRLGEWCSRVLWDIREQIVSENKVEGSFYADRMIFAAASLLKTDTSITDLKESLLNADEELNCGIHSRSIQNAFESRGFSNEVKNLDNPLLFKGSVSWSPYSNEQSTRSFSVDFTITNTNSELARNVRLVLESPNGDFSPIVYEQAFGDLGSGKTVTVGVNGPIPIDYSVMGTIPANRNYKGIKIILRVKIDNGPDTVIQGSL